MQASPLQCGKYPNYRLAFYFNYYSGLSSCQKVTYVYEYIQNKDTVPDNYNTFGVWESILRYVIMFIIVMF